MDRETVTALEELQKTVVSCTRCPRLVAHREEVARVKRRMYLDWDYWGRPLPSFGDPEARLLILGLAPAAHGGNRTGRMFTGDSSADFLFRTLHRFGFASAPTSRRRDDGLTLHDAYITAALRCAPPANKPLRDELASCEPYLLEELSLLREVRVVLGLGKIAFDAYLRSCTARGLSLPSPRPKFGHGVTYPMPDGTRLVGAYHPSRQNTQTGRLTVEAFDDVFEGVKRLLEPGD
jgi:uracil-DNA glycosylase family 4